MPHLPDDDGYAPPLKVLRKRLNGVYREDYGLSGPTRRYILMVALLVGLASIPTLAVVTAGTSEIAGNQRDGAMDAPFLPPPATGPVRPSPDPGNHSRYDGPERSPTLSGTTSPPGVSPTVRTGDGLPAIPDLPTVPADPPPSDVDHGAASRPVTAFPTVPGLPVVPDEEPADDWAGGPLGRRAPQAGDGGIWDSPEFPEVPADSPEIPAVPEVPTDSPDVPEVPADSLDVPEVPADSPDVPEVPAESPEPAEPLAPTGAADSPPSADGPGSPPSADGADDQTSAGDWSPSDNSDSSDDADSAGEASGRDPSDNSDDSSHHECEAALRSTVLDRRRSRSRSSRRSAVTERPHINAARVVAYSYGDSRNVRRSMSQPRSDENRITNRPYRGHHRAEHTRHDENTPARHRSSRVGRHHADPADAHHLNHR
ncbi:hypothetical protein BJY16_001669 [Actinoplanes octamycinicus]|uniref:Uncharacterized protein n=1 Tax=Actinoplanes octamycinicus TaxID=135948 RepID=A0A7W7M603_9ACTN|nr:hypothetical protein [Actinoplanes octamycinicus]MBB4738210.1 hypothetical protein [Actinoplanes octamycinicus]GIE59231.1 hypothetical protein Aoc01nite_46330 [Actinoplanes octamycinicus]